MRAYRHSYYKKKKRIHALPALLIFGAAAVFLLGGWSKKLSGFGREFGRACYEEILKFYMPGAVYAETAREDETVAERVLSHFFLMEGEAVGEHSYATQIESELSYEAVLAREAADENYVEEGTGEVILAGEAVEELPGQNGTGSAAETAGQTMGTNAGKVVTYSREKLNDFDYLTQNFYQIDSTTTIGADQLNMDALLGRDMRLSHDPATPQILIYHTHSQEAYADSVPGDPATSVVGVGDYLTRLLTERCGMNVIHHKEEYDALDRDHAYSKAGPGVEQVLKENPGIEVVIDLHRDGVREDTRLVANLNGTEMAQIMFFNGLSRTTSMGDIGYLRNPYIADNLALSFQMQLKAAEYYPGFTRRIYLKGYRYNMHYCPKTLLIEVGAQTNTVQEAMNAMVPLADLLHKVLTGPQ